MVSRDRSLKRRDYSPAQYAKCGREPPLTSSKGTQQAPQAYTSDLEHSSAKMV